MRLQRAEPPRQERLRKCARGRRAACSLRLVAAAHRSRCTCPPELLEQIAERAAEILAERQSELSASPWLDVDEAARYLRCGTKQRIYDLVHARKLQPARDGRRLLFHRDGLNAYLAGGSV
jgi:excisionase family DNA binding protein